MWFRETTKELNKNIWYSRTDIQSISTLQWNIELYGASESIVAYEKNTYIIKSLIYKSGDCNIYRREYQLVIKFTFHILLNTKFHLFILLMQACDRFFTTCSLFQDRFVVQQWRFKLTPYFKQFPWKIIKTSIISATRKHTSSIIAS